jgi:hypothetical protein
MASTTYFNDPYNEVARATDQEGIPMVTLPPFPSFASFPQSYTGEIEADRKESCPGFTSDAIPVDAPFIGPVKKNLTKEYRMKPDPNAPKKPFQPYIYFSNSIRDAIKNEKPDISFSDLGKEMGKRFKALSPEEHQYWKDVAAQEKEAYERALKSYQSSLISADQSSSSIRPACDGTKTKNNNVDPNAPKKPNSAYIRFSNSVRESIKQKYPQMSPNDVSREVSKRFKELPPDEKKYLDSVVKKETDIYRQMLEDYNLRTVTSKTQSFLSPPEISSTNCYHHSKSNNYSPLKAKKKRVVDPNAPKKPCTAYIYFSNSVREDIKLQNPEFTFTDIAKEMGRRFKQLDPEGKKYWQDIAMREKERYDRELEAYTQHSAQNSFMAAGETLASSKEVEDKASTSDSAYAFLPI